MTLTALEGWTVQATSPPTFAAVAPGETATTTWRVSVPADATPGGYELSAQAKFTSISGQGGPTDVTPVSVPFPSLTGAFDNLGVNDDANPGAGNLDGGGYSYSGQALAAGTPRLTPGAPDNVLAGGQTIALSGSGTTLGFLSTATTAPRRGPPRSPTRTGAPSPLRSRSRTGGLTRPSETATRGPHQPAHEACTTRPSRWTRARR